MTFEITAGNRIRIDKSPNARLDYTLDMTDWLSDYPGDTLASLDVTTNGVTLESSSVNGLSLVAWFSGGTVGQQASAVYQFTTTQGRTDTRTIYFRIRDL